ncbi:MAG: DUF58 domain-containing protein [Phycisphaerales bacterium]|jgi:hypothetical protein|nr:DUF58 domain-containing protein [Phycisphaeraceae bacterium]
MFFGTLTQVPTDLDQVLDPAMVARLERLDVASRKTFAGKLQGERRSKRRGRSVEFDDYRAYTPGDDLRFVDWNVLARLDRFFIKLFQDEQDLALHVILDVSPSMNAGAGDGNKLLFGARLAASLGALGLINNNRVMVSLVGDTRLGLRRLEPLRGRRNLPRFGRFILDEAFAGIGSTPAGRAGPVIAGDLAAGMRLLAADAARSGSGVTVIISDLLLPPMTPEPGCLAALRPMAATAGNAGHDVYVLQTLSPEEIDPAGEAQRDPQIRRMLSGDMRLSDSETGRGVEVTITPELLREASGRSSRFVRSVGRGCSAMGLVHELVPSTTDIAVLLIETLRSRGMLR